jgi:hypothetical protein
MAKADVPQLPDRKRDQGVEAVDVGHARRIEHRRGQKVGRHDDKPAGESKGVA